jgi:hypothetical protein
MAGEALPLVPRRLDERLDGRRTVVSRLLRSLVAPAGVTLPLVVVVVVQVVVAIFPVGEAFGMGRRLLRRPLAIALAGRETLGRPGVCWVVVAPAVPVVCTVLSRGRADGASGRNEVETRARRRWRGGASRLEMDGRTGDAETRLVP